MEKSVKRTSIYCVIFLCMLLTGCGIYEPVMEVSRVSAVNTKEAAAGETALTHSADSGEYEEVQDLYELTAEQIQQARQEQNGRYAYDCISDKEQALYAEILLILQNYGKNVRISSRDSEEIGRVFQCVLNDHPEIFWVSGYSYTKYTLGEEIRSISFSGDYTMSREEATEHQSRIEAYASECFLGLNPAADEYEKVKYVYEYIIKNTEYNLLAENNQDICSVFLNGESVCQGYAKAMQYLLERLGIFSTLVIGYVESGEGHAWNLVRIEGAYYYVDATWGDVSYVPEGSEYSYPEEKLPEINYDYLCVTTRQLTVTHTVDNVVPMPECVSMDANYYVKSDAYFTVYDRERIEKLFQRGYERGDEFVTIKCADRAVYEQMKQILIEDNEVFQYMKAEDGMVAYTDSGQQFTISFWL